MRQSGVCTLLPLVIERFGDFVTVDRTGENDRMNEQAAHALIYADLRHLQEHSYADFSALIGKVETKELVGEVGKTYQLEIQAFWDSKKGADIRLIVAADDGGLEGVQATDGRPPDAPGWLAGVKVSCRSVDE